MLKIDDNLLQQIGLGALPAEEKRNLLAHIYETLEMRVGMRLADQMTNEQLDEFEMYFEAKDDAGAFKWLESNFPNYKDIVNDEFEKLKVEVQQSAPQILGAAQTNAAAGQLPPQQPADTQQYVQQQYAPPQMAQPQQPQAWTPPVANDQPQPYQPPVPTQPAPSDQFTVPAPQPQAYEPAPQQYQPAPEGYQPPEAPAPAQSYAAPPQPQAWTPPTQPQAQQPDPYAAPAPQSQQWTPPVDDQPTPPQSQPPQAV